MRAHSGTKPDRPPATLCLRLSLQERQTLEHEAGEMPLGAYIRRRLFASDRPHPHPHNKRPIKDRHALGQLLAALGEAQLADSLNRLSQAVESGSLPVCSETQNALRRASDDLQWMRRKLLEALAVEPEEGEKTP